MVIIVLNHSIFVSLNVIVVVSLSWASLRWRLLIMLTTTSFTVVRLYPTSFT